MQPFSSSRLLQLTGPSRDSPNFSTLHPSALELHKMLPYRQQGKEREVGYHIRILLRERPKDVPALLLYKCLEHLSREKDWKLIKPFFDYSKELYEVNDVNSPFVQRISYAAVLNAGIIAFAAVGHYNFARTLQEDMRRIDFVPESNAFAAFIANVQHSGTHDEAHTALALLAEAKQNNVPLTSFLYNTVIAKLSRARKLDIVFDLYFEMKVQGNVPTPVTYGTIISACCRTNREAMAVDTFNEMSRVFGPGKSKVAPFNIMIQYYVNNARNRDQALFYFQKLIESNVTPTDHTYRLLIDAYATLEPVNMLKAEEVLAKICEDGNKVTSMHLGALIHASGCVQHDLAKVYEYKAQLQTGKMSHQVEPDECIFQTLIEAFCANNEIATARSLLPLMPKHHVQLTCYMANAFIDAYGRQGMVEEAEAIYKQLDTEKTSKYGREPNTFYKMTDLYLNAGEIEKAANTVREMTMFNFPRAIQRRVDELYASRVSVKTMVSETGSETSSNQQYTNTDTSSSASINGEVKSGMV